MTATTLLRKEHDTILAVLACIREACAGARSAGGFDADTFRQVAEFIRNYADAWHHAKEEGLLFPALEAHGMPREGGPVGVMLYEHEIGRSHVRSMQEHLEAAAAGDSGAQARVVEHALAYADLLEQHIQKENGILFNLADQLLPPEEQERLVEAYGSTRPEGADPAAGERYEQLARDLCAKWGVDPEQARFRGPGFGCGAF